MKRTALIYKSNTDHPWHLIEELPEEPKPIKGDIGNLCYRALRRDYEYILQRAIDNAVRVENQEAAEQTLKGKYPDFPEPDKVYPVEVSYEIYSKCQYPDCFLCERVARLLICKEEGRPLTPEQFYASGNYPVLKDKFDMQRNQFDYYEMMQFAYDYAEARIKAEIERLKEGRN